MFMIAYVNLDHRPTSSSLLLDDEDDSGWRALQDAGQSTVRSAGRLRSRE